MGDTLESLAHLEARIWWVSCDLHEKRGIDNKCAQRIGPSPTEASILWSTIQHGWIISVDFSYFFLTHWRILYYPFQEIYDAPNNGPCGKNFLKQGLSVMNSMKTLEVLHWLSTNLTKLLRVHWYTYSWKHTPKQEVQTWPIGVA